MEFDKSIGTGYWNVEDATYIDNVAFQLMCDDIKERGNNYRNQAYFRHWKDDFPYNKYYEKAKTLIIQEKINKLIDGRKD